MSVRTVFLPSDGNPYRAGHVTVILSVLAGTGRVKQGLDRPAGPRE
jgi:hypothetical protein